ncbi:xanthine dehydrogenase accessory protein XdhC [Aidingimonas halophila]|uniref:Molybdenum cofactor sulfurylase n=1 Tax=Aidingimonas halophila TaxID=574349 RepID=A0A1H3GHV2_9GAMM|nr:xanthine dehydrogenase accessory protein XdhC [Aidingimonas halophila]GHC33243.1 xanthine dehydrogenase accessory protein XdhC [Aidingimonas halophila]SDY02585.1 molybdenum cofactor sulfurylase [Aidingimonas halophila]
MNRPDVESMSWHEALHALQCRGQPHALASIVGTAGSTPREPGAKMVITADDVHDTLGGGTFEYQVIAQAREAIASDDTGPHLEAFPLGGRSGQCCGGYVHVLIEVFSGAEATIALFGAGHVGQALIPALAPLPWRILWLDSRPDAFPAKAANQPRLECRGIDDPTDSSVATSVVGSLPSGIHALVMTHDHGQDRALIDALLRHGDCASIGLIGSDSKWASFKRRLRDGGHSEEALERVRCPIGIAGAKGKRPYEIALAVAAELLTLTSEATGQPPDRRGIAPDTLRDIFSPSSTDNQ